MKRIITLLTLVLTFALHAETLYLVKDGRITPEATKEGGSWKEQGGKVTGKGTGQKLLLRRAAAADDFTLSTTLSLPKLGHTAAGVLLGGDFFGFDGARGFFVEGSGFGGTKHLTETKASIEEGEPFTLTAAAKDGKMTFKIDGELVASLPYKAERISTVGLRPHRGEMNISEFKVQGDFIELEKLNHLFASGREGYKSYRIPAMVTTPKGTLLAFAEGRKNHAGDHGDIDIVMKRSTDGGKTWSPLSIVYDFGDHVAGNPCPIVDEKNNRIILLSCTSSVSEHGLMQGEGRRGIFMQFSNDDGKTWSKPHDIAANIYPENWRWYATGPCSGIQIKEGKHAGRLVAPANHSIFENDKNTYRAHSIYSDDFGRTWQLGDAAAAGSNESQIAEAGPDLLYQNMRMQTHRQGVRGIRYSKDGGKTWTDLAHDFNLPGPRCQGSVIRDHSHPSRLIFANPASRGGRENMTIRISEDGGKSWPFAKPVLDTSSAYSDLAITADGKVALLFEGGHYAYGQEGIIFGLHSLDSIKQEPKRESIIPADKNGWGLWKERHQKFNQQAGKGDIDLLLLGDSITHYWQNNKMEKTDGQAVWDKYFKNKKVANFGIGSDRTQHLLYRLQNGNLNGISPKYAVVMIGTNNVSSGHSPYDIYLGTKAIISTIQKASPNTKILLYDIFPRNRGGETAWNHCEQANDLVDSLADGENVIRCSINDQLLDANGKPNKEIFFDGIHMNEKGYEIWAKDILKHAKGI